MKFLAFLVLFSCASLKSPPEEATIWSKYEEVMVAHPAKEKIFDCKKPDITTSKKAMKYKASLTEQLPLLVRPNFNGTHYLLEIGLTGGSEWMIVDCKSGELRDTGLAGHLAFSYDSSVVIKNPPSSSETFANYPGAPAVGLPEIWRWEGTSFLKLENRIQK